MTTWIIIGILVNILYEYLFGSIDRLKHIKNKFVEDFEGQYPNVVFFISSIIVQIFYILIWPVAFFEIIYLKLWKKQ